MKHHEYWPGRLFETPGYIYLAWRCLRHFLFPLNLGKSNYGIDHGGYVFSSKYQMQLDIAPDAHPKTIFLGESESMSEKIDKLKSFINSVGYPVILKPDYGFVGKGLLKVSGPDDIEKQLGKLRINYIAQEYIDLPMEFGVFFMRYKGRVWVESLNQKHFPTVIGDGNSSVLELAQSHERYTHYWASYLKYVDLERIPAAGESLRLSFIGSHTMGCKFTYDNDLITPELEKSLEKMFENSPGFNYGRLDLRAKSIEDLQQGKAQLIEINGIDSLPTNMFDPKDSVWKAYRILFRHFYWLAKIAAENRHQPKNYGSILSIYKRSVDTVKGVNRQQEALED